MRRLHSLFVFFRAEPTHGDADLSYGLISSGFKRLEWRNKASGLIVDTLLPETTGARLGSQR